MFDEVLVQEIAADEGFRERAYKDSLGYWTIGVGHLLGYGNDLIYSGISWDPIRVMVTFMQDLNESNHQIRNQISVFDQLTTARQRVLINMMFNLGPHKFSGFVKTKEAIHRLDYYGAYIEMLDSKWARDDVPNRAHRLARSWLRG